MMATSFGSPSALRCKETASYLLNNLSAHGVNVIYVHDNHVWLINDKSNNCFFDNAGIHQVEYTSSDPIAQAIITRTSFGTNIFIASQNGEVCILNEQGRAKLSTKQLAVNEVPSCLCTDSQRDVFVACTNGNIHVLSIKKKSSLNHSRILCEHKLPILCITAHARYMASADSDGNIIAWRLDTNHIQVCARFTGMSIPCTSLVLHRDCIIAGYANGGIHIYNITTQTLQVEIAAHTRGINALAYDGDRNLLASVSDDSFVNVWKIPTSANDEKVTNVRSLSITNRVLCGVQFCGADMSTLTTVAYDSRMLHVIKPY